MDNTLKLLISVLSIAGLIALFTPAPEEVPAPATEATAANAAAVPDRIGEPEVVAPEDAEEDDLLAGFGEPMNDGKPIDPVTDDEDGEEAGNSGQASNDATPQFSPPSEGGGAGVSSSAPSPAASAARAALPEPVPIPNAPKVSRVPLS